MSKVSNSLQAIYDAPAVLAGPLGFAAKTTLARAIGKTRGTKAEAEADLAAMEAIISQCPKNQQFAALQAAMSVCEAAE